MAYTITENKQFNSIEIKFDEKPNKAITDGLKALRFRWHSVKGIWYGYKARETVEKVLNGQEVKTDKNTATKGEIVNKYGVKVGDIFEASWGYEQTNVNFLQVVKLCGESSVRVREVVLPRVKAECETGLSGDYTYNVVRDKILEPKSHASFIKDQINGDLKRVKKTSYNDDVIITLESYASAYLVKEDTIKCYESWYY